MASRIARSVFPSAARASARSTRGAQQLSRRHMSASESAHGSHHSGGSDRPWIIGSALVFGPFFLYLLSPSARKSHAQHAIHDDKHDFGIHASQHASHHVEVKMTDDEGTEANVADSLAASEHEDAPKVGDAVEEFNSPSVSSSPDIDNVKDSSEGEAKSEQPEPDATADADTSVQVPPTNLGPIVAPEHEEQVEERTEKEGAEEKQQDKKAGEA